jgi:hypothetical protein
LTALAALVIAPSLLRAKGSTVRITITGGDLKAPVDINDGAVAARFHVWSGAGASVNEPQGLNVDFSQGVVEPPAGVPVYEVSFVTTRRNPGTYVVRYAIDPATNQGCVYLPGKRDPEYRDNVWLIYRGVEGNWFRAWSEWERLAHPLIVRARTGK